ncbi:MAG: c-type cytochrome [Melioribacteraceae bacterium]|nr:MAG: c-type cytochrome [Melioribacteraceae bacterium]
MNPNKKYEPEIDFKALLKNPKRLFGWVFPYFFILMLMLGIFYVKNLNAISENTAQVNAPIEDEVKRTISAKKGAIMPAVDLEVIKNPSSDFIAKGKELYQQSCASCHGNNGLGDGAAGVALNPPPRNLTDLSGWTNGTDFVNLYKTLEEGIVKNGMAAYEYMPPVDRIAMIQYIRTLADYPEITEDQIQEADVTYNLTEGKATSNQITLDEAIDLVVKEKSVSPKLANIMIYMNNHPSIEGRDIFNNVAVNQYRVVSSFASINLNSLSLEEFVQISSSNFNEIGFSANVNTLEQDGWQKLFNYLKNVLGSASV